MSSLEQPRADNPTARPRARAIGIRSRWFPFTIGLIALGGFALRAYYVASVRAHQRPRGDSAYFYFPGAVSLAKGHGFISIAPDAAGHFLPSAKHPPGLTTILAGLYKLGFHSIDSLIYFNVLLGTVTVVLIGVLLSRVVSRRAGVIGALIAAFYPNIWINDTLLMSETLMMFGFTLGLLGVYAFHRRPRWQSILIASAGFTLAASARAESILLFAVILLPLVLARRAVPFRRRVALLGVAAILPLTVFVPWTIYNMSRFAEPVYMSTGFGMTMAASSCPATFHGKNIGYYSLYCSKRYEPKGRAAETMDESEVSAYMRQGALDYIAAHKDRLPTVVVAREARMLGLWNPRQQNFFDRYVQQRGSFHLVRAAQWMFWGLSLLSVAGAILWRRRRIILYPLLAQIGITAFTTALTFGNTRYRCGVEICVVLLAATAIDAGIGWVHRRAVPGGDPASRHQVDHDPVSSPAGVA